MNVISPQDASGDAPAAGSFSPRRPHQEAEAILAARTTMVTGAVGLVQMALASGDHSPSPVINTGPLYT